MDFKARSKNLSNYEHSTEAKEYRKRIEEILYGYKKMSKKNKYFYYNTIIG